MFKIIAFVTAMVELVLLLIYLQLKHNSTPTPIPKTRPKLKTLKRVPPTDVWAQPETVAIGDRRDRSFMSNSNDITVEELEYVSETYNEFLSANQKIK